MVILQNKYNPKNKDGIFLKGCFCGMNMPSGYIPEGFSTDKLMVKFVWFVILSWYVVWLYLHSQNAAVPCMVLLFIFAFPIVMWIPKFCKCKLLYKFLYTDVRNKIPEYEINKKIIL